MNCSAARDNGFGWSWSAALGWFALFGNARLGQERGRFVGLGPGRHHENVSDRRLIKKTPMEY